MSGDGPQIGVYFLQAPEITKAAYQARANGAIGHRPILQKGPTMVTQYTDTTAGFMAAPIQPTTPAFTLFIATYNHAEWERLGDSQATAHEEAERIFPEEDGTPPPYPYAYMNTFYTEFHRSLEEALSGIPDPAPAEKETAVQQVMEAYPGDRNSYGIGWIAVVAAADIPQFRQDAQTLWQMYTIQEIPLNNDQSTRGVYDRMTPAHWGS
jgi:hypothetical protein